MGKLKKAVIPIAGLGTRMLPATKQFKRDASHCGSQLFNT